MSLTETEQKKVATAISRTTPSTPERRGRCLFKFGRHLMAVESLKSKQAVELKPIIRKWWKSAVSVIGDNEWAASWSEFVTFWDGDKIKFAFGEGGAFAEALERAKKNPGPVLNESVEYTLLVALCRELQQDAGDSCFFLSTRVGADAIGIEIENHVKVWRFLRTMIAEGYLELVKQGNRKDANEYRFLR